MKGINKWMDERNGVAAREFPCMPSAQYVIKTK